MNKINIILYGSIIIFILNMLFHYYVMKNVKKDKQIPFLFTFIGLFLASSSGVLAVFTNEINFFAKIILIGFILSFIGSIIHLNKFNQNREK